MPNLSRRHFIGLSGLAAAAALVPGCRSRRPSPNIIVILADDLGYGDLSCLNAESRLRTVNIDRLARGGMVFTDAHSGSAVCTPTRYGLLTGRYAWRSRLKQGVLWGYSRSLIPPERLTLASMLKTRGYTTACVGKWHLGLNWQRRGGRVPEDDDRERGDNIDLARPVELGPIDLGFDRFFGIPASLDMPPYVYIRNDRVTALPDRETGNDDVQGFWRQGPTGADFDHHQVLARLTDEAVSFIEGRGQNPFFLYFALTAPHTPILPGTRFRGRSGTNPYGDFVLEVDHSVGRILDTLSRLDIERETLVLFTSDNGCSPRADFPALRALGHFPSYVYRGHKADIFEGGHRIPFILRWPERVAAGGECTETICLTDLFATFAALAGAAVPDDAGEDSFDLSPAILGRPDPPPIRPAVVHHSINGSFAIREGRWKLELCPGSGGWSPPRPGSEEIAGLPRYQLYDLEADAGERVNLVERHPGMVERLRRRLADIVQRGRSTPGPVRSNDGNGAWPQLDWMSDPLP